jgi:hypothetical protein
MALKESRARSFIHEYVNKRQVFFNRLGDSDEPFDQSIDIIGRNDGCAATDHFQSSCGLLWFWLMGRRDFVWHSWRIVSKRPAILNSPLPGEAGADGKNRIFPSEYWSAARQLQALVL